MARPVEAVRAIISQRMATPHGRAVKNAIAGSDIHPACGSGAKGMPPMAKGFHPGYDRPGASTP